MSRALVSECLKQLLVRFLRKFQKIHLTGRASRQGYHVRFGSLVSQCTTGEKHVTPIKDVHGSEIQSARHRPLRQAVALPKPLTLNPAAKPGSS